VTADLTAEQVAHCRQVLAEHTVRPGAKGCPVCGVIRCPDWTDAFDKLAVAGQTMAAEPPPWQPFRPGRRPGTPGTAG
jgi:hypothetical protein